MGESITILTNDKLTKLLKKHKLLLSWEHDGYAWNNPISNGEIDPDHSKPLDVHGWSEHPELNRLVDELWSTVVEPALGGRSNNTGLSGPKKQLKVLLLDLYVAWLEDPTLCVGISRNNNSYSVNSRYNALHISRKIVDIVDVLVTEEYLDYLHGS